MDDGRVVVVGGGLGGLAAATFLGQAGRRVTLLERAPTLGGRAATHAHEGFRFNLGPHALYKGGQAQAVLRALGVSWSGSVPVNAESWAWSGDRLHLLPTGAWSLLRTSLLTTGARWELGRLLATLGRVDADALAGVTLDAWSSDKLRDPVARDLVRFLGRVSTYAHAPAWQSAQVAVSQMRLAALQGVEYLDGGWEGLVAVLERAARAAQVELVCDAKVEAIEHDEAVRAVRLRGGERVEARGVVVALPLKAAAKLLPGVAPLQARAAQAKPARIACLDLALRRFPKPGVSAVFGVDAPWYLSVHSRVARLAPEGGALAHAARYLAPDEPPPARGELEAWLDAVIPGWRPEVLHARWLPDMMAASAIEGASEGGLAGRAAVQSPDVRGLCFAGDWVGSQGALCDASLASAREAARGLLAPR
jgi:phytoene dehydrogenase-like protein